MEIIKSSKSWFRQFGDKQSWKSLNQVNPDSDNLVIKQSWKS